jgi:hypothetical protein
VANLGLSTLSSFLPSINVPVGDHLTLSLSPALFLGGNGFGVGANVGVSVQTPYLTLGASYGATYYGNHPATHTSFVEQRIGYGATIGGRNFHASFGSTTFKGGGVSQMTGFLGFGGKNWGFTYENDYMKVPLAILEGTADGGDRFRTTGLRFQAGDFSVGLNMFTGDPGLKDREKCKIGGDGPKGTYYENSPEYRMGALYIGYGNYRAGVNSENVRAGVQHWVHKQTGDPQFYKTNSNWSVYSGIMTKNPFTTW